MLREAESSVQEGDGVQRAGLTSAEPRAHRCVRVVQVPELIGRRDRITKQKGAELLAVGDDAGVRQRNPAGRVGEAV